jgi:hypothetical protein
MPGGESPRRFRTMPRMSVPYADGRGVLFRWRAAACPALHLLAGIFVRCVPHRARSDLWQLCMMPIPPTRATAHC